jgi:orotidine-5'-phosphate decarboxylase
LSVEDFPMRPVEPRIVVALDFPDRDRALRLVDRIPPGRCRLKVGFELFVAAGPALVAELADRGFGVFLDLKFHDIPNTVAGAVRAASKLGVWMINVHASGGRRMMEAARAALPEGPGRPRLVAVTVLTSLAAADLRETGVGVEPEAQVLRLARLTRECGLDGVVCSAREAAALRRELGEGFLLVTPGIRPAGGDTADQRRVMTPCEAMAAGADYLVVGRPVTEAQDPARALAGLEAEIRACG